MQKTGNLLLFFIFILCFTTKAYNVPFTQDTSKTHILDELATRNIFLSDYEISKSEFLKKYAFDYRSKQIISKSFSKTELAFFFFALPILASIVILLGGLLVIAGASSGEIILITGVIIYSLTWLFRIAGVFLLIDSSKKKLLVKLIKYRKQYNLSNKKND